MFTANGKKLFQDLIAYLNTLPPSRLDAAFSHLEDTEINRRYKAAAQNALALLECLKTDVLANLLAIDGSALAALGDAEKQNNQKISQMTTALYRFVEKPIMITDQLQLALTAITSTLAQFDSQIHLQDLARKAINAKLNGLTLTQYCRVQVTNGLFTGASSSKLMTIMPVVNQYRHLFTNLLEQIPFHKHEAANDNFMPSEAYTEATFTLAAPNPSSKNQMPFTVVTEGVWYSAEVLFPTLRNVYEITLTSSAQI